ncbi:FAD/NAD(P)-binding protein [Corynebacterium sp. HMSC055D05]|uniref:FAD/NAD(P)-binding protein n=1 Tax=Corynebacterium sp. HMSC055D05 TaxID=1715213 RepID=UPI0008A37915|nr:FAD/NAD(P)-binding protein [Corynebacterium sp. HMSC055D05]OFL90455.1 hypothetical protein HMPREF2734_03660 [Corynebacterium sp. HMSC055D05]
MKVAIIGAGPRGLWAAEELIARAGQRGAAIELTVFNETPMEEISAPGAFGESVPEQWILNAPKSIVETHLGPLDPNDELEGQFPPRRRVGEHLDASWEALQKNLPAQCTLKFRIARVQDVTPVGETVEVDGEQFDEVLMVTGHAHDWPGSLAHQDLGDLRVIAPPYPSSNLDAVTPDDIALVRGAALTFIDVVRYAEAKAFYPVTRSGRFMEVKAYLTGEQERRAQPIIAEADQAILHCQSLDELKEILAQAASDILTITGGEATREEIQAVINGEDFTGDPVEELRTSIAAAQGEQPWTPALAVALAFRDTEDALIQRASFGGRESLGGSDFDDFMSTLGRVATGPPVESAAEMLALIDDNRIRTDVFDRGEDDLEVVAQEVGATVVIDAVNAPAGVVEGTLIGDLVDRGVGMRYADTNALHIHPDGTLVGQTHLAAAGRMNEGLVIGHDTLRRDKQNVIYRWAERVSARAAE